MLSFTLENTVTLASLFLTACEVVLAAITLLYLKDVHAKVKALVGLLAGTGAMLLVVIVATALAHPTSRPTGPEPPSLQVATLLEALDRLTAALEEQMPLPPAVDDTAPELRASQERFPGPLQAPHGTGVTLEADRPPLPKSFTPAVDLGPGPRRYTPQAPGQGPGKEDGSEAGGAGSALPTPAPPASSSAVGNLVTCAPPNPPHNAWIWLYRLDGNEHWQRISKGIGAIDPSGRLKIDGLPVDVDRFGTRGEPYRIELVIDGRVVESTGNFQAGEPEFRLFPDRDNATSWPCPYPVQ